MPGLSHPAWFYNSALAATLGIACMTATLTPTFLVRKSQRARLQHLLSWLAPLGCAVGFRPLLRPTNRSRGHSP